MGWHQELLVGFDLETTGTDPLRGAHRHGRGDRGGGGTAEPLGRGTWLADPGIRIPEQAVGDPRHQQRAGGGRGPARRARWRTRSRTALAEYWRAGVPVVAYNAAFDLTLLAAELRRHGLPSLRDRLGGADPGPVIDPYTIDRAVDRYRRGKRNLEAVCTEYGVALDGAPRRGGRRPGRGPAGRTR